MFKQDHIETTIHIVDAAPHAYERWVKRCVSSPTVTIECHANIPAGTEWLSSGVWVLAPDSFTSPAMRHALLTIIQSAPSSAQIMVVCSDPTAAAESEPMEHVIWIEADESERAIIRGLRSLVRTDKNQQALKAALQFPAENPNPVLCLEPSGELVYANPTATALLHQTNADGWTVTHLLQEQLGHLGEDVAGTTHCVISLAELSYGFRFESDEQAGRVNVYGIDITANLNAEHTRIALEQQSRNKDAFLAAMSHELRTPLNAVLSCTEAMREGTYGAMNRQQLDAVRTIRESGKHLLCLITDILDISKIQAGRLELNPATLGIQAVCDSVIEMVRGQADDRNIEVSLSNTASFSTFRGDPLRMKQVLLNLLGNAIKFTPKNGHVGLTVGPGNTPRTIEFRVWDTGPGVGAKYADTIFKPFIQAEGDYSRSQPGTGLGLAIARHLTRLHDGELTLERLDSPGAVFIVTLPIGETQDEPAFDFRSTGSWNISPAPTPEEPLTKEIEKVLIAEDTDSNYHHLHDMLVSLGYSVDRAVNGQEAIDLCTSMRPDLVLMDLDMPFVNGIDAIRVIRQDAQNQHLPIIAVTAMSGVAEEQACLAAGANGFLAKPYPLRDLMMLMKQVSP